MYSSKTISDKEWSERFHEGDAVLNVKHIEHYAKLIKGDVTTSEIKGGMHDLVLSKKEVRTKVYETIFEWMNEHFR